MTLKNDRDLASTQEKLRLLEAHYEELRDNTEASDRLHEITMQSLEELISQVNGEVSAYLGGRPEARN